MTLYEYIKSNDFTEENAALILARMYVGGMLTQKAVHYDMPDPEESDITKMLQSELGKIIVEHMHETLMSEVSADDSTGTT